MAVTRTRRTQSERTAETRRALIDAAIVVLHRHGYGGASTALIAEQAGVSRGSILHQFGTREELMVQVVRSVFEDEMLAYAPLLQAEPTRGGRMSEYVEAAFQVLNRPSGLAVMEVFLGSRSDPKLAARLRPIQAGIERDSVAALSPRFGSDERTKLERVRMLVWSMRGLSLAQLLFNDPEEIRGAVRELRRIIEAAEDAGALQVPGPPAEPG